MERIKPTSAYQVRLDSFQGPMDVLMHLIEKQKVDIYNIPILEITDQYLSYLSQMKECDLEVTGDFLVMAATLIDIKSKMLLPTALTSEEEEEDPRTDLMERLMEYKKFKEAAKKIKDRENSLETRFFKTREDLSFLEETIDKDNSLGHFTARDLLDTWEKLMKKRSTEDNKSDPFSSVQKDPVTVEEKVQELRDRLEKESQLFLEKVFERSVDKIHLITTFLAVLELAKNRVILIKENNKNYGIVLHLRQKSINV